tara:strand:+ start:739 stop:1584 length:846 start_codon:yes stop_codon:yes gene_type:complete
MSMKFLKTVAGAAVSSLWEKVSGNVVVKDTSASVGIGTDDPGNVLEVAGDAHTKVLVSSTGAAHAVGLQITQDSDGSPQIWQLQTIQSSDSLIFRDGTDGRTDLTFDGAGNINVNSGNLTATAGNFVIGTAGKGIDFSATSDVTGATSELLDDYEEGVHTMVPNTNLTLESTAAVCSYVKIGRLVNIRGQLDVDAVSGTDAVTLTMPFTNAASPTNGKNNVAGTCMPKGVNIGDAGLVAYMGASTSLLKFYKINDDSSYTQLNNGGLAAADLINFNITMLV